MKKLIVLLVMMLAVSGCASAQPTPAPLKPELIAGVDYDDAGGADAYASLGDHADSIYYTHPDFYRMKSTDSLTIVSMFKTMQQTTEWSCGNVAALMALTHLGIKDYTEMSIAQQVKSSTDLDVEGALPGSANNFFEYGTNVKQLYDFFSSVKGLKITATSYQEVVSQADLLKVEDGVTPNDVGNLRPTFDGNSLYASENTADTQAWVEDAKDSYFVKYILDNLKNNRLMLVEWGDWDGHWTTIIGYDTMGTPGLGDDVMIFADSYDTSDHWQDGYRTYPAERFFYMWKDRNIAPKPFQLQPFITIEKVNE